MVQCTDPDVNCASQRLLRREGDADLKERRGYNINNALILLSTVYKIQTNQHTPSFPPLPNTASIKILQKQIYPAEHSAKPQISSSESLRHSLLLSYFVYEAV